MGSIKAARIVELSAGVIAWGQGGSPRAASAIGRWAASWGVPFPPTDEETAARRRSEVYIAGPRGEARVNNGRGERIFDAVVCSPVEPGVFVEYVPVSFKVGDARDITTDIKLVRAIVAAGAPIWVYHLSAPGASDVEYADGVRVDIPMVEPATMRRVNITPVVQDLLKSWDLTLGETEAKGEVVFLRRHTVKSAGKVYDYPRLRVRLGSIPAHYWLDKEPVKFDAYAPLPSPFKVG